MKIEIVFVHNHTSVEYPCFAQTTIDGKQVGGSGQTWEEAENRLVEILKRETIIPATKTIEL